MKHQQLIEVPACCADYETNRPVLVRPLGDPLFSKFPVYCPWCGCHLENFRRTISAKISELMSKNLLN